MPAAPLPAVASGLAGALPASPGLFSMLWMLALRDDLRDTPESPALPWPASASAAFEAAVFAADCASLMASERACLKEERLEGLSLWAFGSLAAEGGLSLSSSESPRWCGSSMMPTAGPV
jgi:hypothetical protein